METSELLKKVRKIEIKTKGLSRHIFSGEYHSAFKGRGMSFSEVRNYQYGDDIRNIDWNVTARTGDPHVKIFEEERELTVMLLVDVSRSSLFGSVAQRKSEIIIEICALLAFSAITNNDKVGVLLFSDRIERFIPPKKGKSHILRIIRELLDCEPAGHGTDIGLALDYLNNVLKKRAICFVISDFITEGYEKPLQIAARRHDMIGIRVTDPREAELPAVGLLRALDAETGEELWLDTGAKALRERYAQRFADQYQYFRSIFLKNGADIVDIPVDRPYIQTLLQFFQKRAA